MSETPATTVNSSISHHGHHHRGHRLRNFLKPDGTEVHIALSPEEAENLRERLTQVRKDEPFDLVINGSPEHLEALRHAHAHHEARRDSLKVKHGEAFDEFENVTAELDALSSELHMLTDHAVQLDANFSKYGYAAHLRTYDDSSTPGSGATSIRGFHDDDHESKKDWEAERKTGHVMRIYKKPTVRQYFHKGLLWRASETTTVASFELFLDLLYVGILAINGDHASEVPTGSELLRFSITFIMSWKIWSDVALIISWFLTDDIIQRLSILFIMACLLGLTINMLEAFEHTYSMLVAFYLAARLFMACYLAVMGALLPMIKGTMILQCITTIIPAAMWIGSIYIEIPNRYAIIWITLAFELAAPNLALLVIRSAKLISADFGALTDRVFEFMPAINIEHKVERTNAFVTLVFGYSVVAIIYQSSASFGMNAFFGKACLGLIQAFCFNWIYFELDGEGLHQHAIRRSIYSAMIWTTVHLPFIMSFTLAAAALSKLVVATDCSNADAEDLTEFYQHKSENHIPTGLRWFYCAGLGIALLGMGIISLTHVHKDPAAGVRLPKKFRMLNRFVVCVILTALGSAEHLNSLHLISITTSLVVWVLLLELWGSSCPKDSLFGQGSEKQCKYTAKCKISKKDLESASKVGNVIKVEELGDRGEKGLYEFN